MQVAVTIMATIAAAGVWTRQMRLSAAAGKQGRTRARWRCPGPGAKGRGERGKRLVPGAWPKAGQMQPQQHLQQQQEQPDQMQGCEIRVTCNGWGLRQEGKCRLRG